MRIDDSGFRKRTVNNSLMTRQLILSTRGSKNGNSSMYLQTAMGQCACRLRNRLALLICQAGMVCSVLVWFVIVMFWFGLDGKVEGAKHTGSKLYLQILLLNYCTVACCRALIVLFLLFIISGHKIMLIPLNKLSGLVHYKLIKSIQILLTRHYISLE